MEKRGKMKTFIDNISFISQIGNITNEFPAVSLIFYF